MIFFTKSPGTDYLNYIFQKFLMRFGYSENPQYNSKESPFTPKFRPDNRGYAVQSQIRPK